uniref:ADP,ATP carrier protein n=1 Tax=Eutreptiella gymnastica TaxID=73025 RepID=A0A7S1J8F8_9EUGL
MEEGPWLFFVASFASGLCATTLSAPADLVKTRVMNDRAMAQVNQAARTSLSFRSATDCVVQTVRQEGARALFKGWLPSWLRLGPHFMISWPLMEFVRKHLFGLDYF